jgi:hypothetical protein
MGAFCFVPKLNKVGPYCTSFSLYQSRRARACDRWSIFRHSRKGLVKGDDFIKPFNYLTNQFYCACEIWPSYSKQKITIQKSNHEQKAIQSSIERKIRQRRKNLAAKNPVAKSPAAREKSCIQGNAYRERGQRGKGLAARERSSSEGKALQ